MENDDFVEKIKEFYTFLTDETGHNESNTIYLKLFSKLQIQIEGWFRGELMTYLERKKIEMKVENREVRISNTERKKVDLKIKINNRYYWIELKHILVGSQGNNNSNNYCINFYFNKNTDIDNDIQQLKKTEDKEPDSDVSRYCLVFLSTNNEGKIAKIESKKDLDSKVNEELKNRQYKSSVELIHCDYELALHFGYFLLKVEK